jgi:fumarate hydratase class II
MTATRTESDSFGPLEVPTDKYWGAQTQRSIMNFPIGWEKQPVAIVRALGVIKRACAEANKASGKLDARLADAIIAPRRRSSTASSTTTSRWWSGRPGPARSRT